MNATILKRIKKLEGPVSSGSGWHESLTHEELLTLARVCSALIITAGNQDDPEGIKHAQDTITGQDKEVGDWLAYYRRPDVAAAIKRNRDAGIPRDRYFTDWEGLAAEWGLAPPPNGVIPTNIREGLLAKVPPDYAAWLGPALGLPMRN